MSKHSSIKFKGQTLPRQIGIEKAKEIEIEKLVKDIENLDDSCKIAVKNCKSLVESHTCVVKSEQTLVNDLINQFPDPTYRDHVTPWIEILEIKEDAFKTMDNVILRGLHDPLKKYQTFFPGVSQFVKRRELAMKDLLSAQSRLDRYETKERTGPHIVRIHEARSAVEQAKAKYEEMTNTFCQDAPRLYRSKDDILSPSLEAIILGQLTLYQNLHKASTKMAECLGQDVDLLMDGNSPEDHLAKRLRDITSLAIVKPE